MTDRCMPGTWRSKSGRLLQVRPCTSTTAPFGCAGRRAHTASGCPSDWTVNRSGAVCAGAGRACSANAGLRMTAFKRATSATRRMLRSSGAYCSDSRAAMLFPESLRRDVPPALECAMERGGLGIAEEVRDFSDRECGVGDVALRRIAADVVEELLVRQSGSGQPTLQCAR